jgi:hypothetical protein
MLLLKSPALCEGEVGMNFGSTARISSGRSRFPASTSAKSSLWQKANRDECLVTQTIRIALTRYS